MPSINSSPLDANALERAISTFLAAHYDPGRPLLLALSGGPDSLALLHVLLDYQKQHPLSFGIGHVDHGWRVESSDEARLLQQMARALELPFHLKRLNPKEFQGNLEAFCREERLKFFSELCRLHGYQAVLLAHHRDDQIETVLKRVLEGASLPYLSSMLPIAQVNEVSIWRPMLSMSKGEILSWLDAKGLKGFDDGSNLDPKFLRGKLRTRLLPLLAAEFGKEVGSSLERLGTEAKELRHYLDDRINGNLSQMEKSALGLFLDLSQDCPAHPFELRYLIRRLCEEADLSLSRDALDTAVKLISSGAADKQIEAGTRLLKIDRKRLFLPFKPWKPILERCKLVVGEITIGEWRVEVREGETSPDKAPCSSWRESWRGKMEVFLPLAEYEIGGVQLHASYRGGTSINKWWTNAKVPAFMRQPVPVIWQKDQIYHEFLTGKRGASFIFVEKWLHVILERL